MFWKLPIFECATVYQNFNMDSSIKHFQHVTPITPGMYMKCIFDTQRSTGYRYKVPRATLASNR